MWSVSYPISLCQAGQAGQAGTADLDVVLDCQAGDGISSSNVMRDGELRKFASPEPCGGRFPGNSCQLPGCDKRLGPQVAILHEVAPSPTDAGDLRKRVLKVQRQRAQFGCRSRTVLDESWHEKFL